METNKAEEPIGSYGIEYNYADYLNFDFEVMVELIKGRIFKMSPAPRINHQDVSIKLLKHLLIFFENKACKVYHAPTDVILPIGDKKRERSTTVVQPDIVVVCDISIIEERGIFGVPNLIIEILSPHTKKKDLQDKYDVYEEAGVKEYWIAMPEEKLIEVFVLENNSYRRIKTYVDTEVIICETLPGLEIDLNEVF